MAPVASIFIFGVLSYVSGVPVLEDNSSKDDPLWKAEQEESEQAAPAAPATLDASFCRRRADGLYPHPDSAVHYYRCSGGDAHVLRCAEGSVFVSGRCEAPAEWRPCVLQPDGLHPNVSDGCASYYRCENGSVSARLRCPLEASGRLAFSARLQRCAPAVEVTCAAATCLPASSADMFFVTPGTACRDYHRCRAGLRADFRCPAGFIFHWATQVCVPAGESAESGCPEPVCVGRVNGRYADTAHGCARWFRCEGGALRQVAPCSPGQLFHAGRCRPAQQVTCPAPPASSRGSAGGASGECAGLLDGLHALAASGCRDYVHCAAGHTLARRSCPDSTLFDGRMCVPAPLVTCRAVSSESRGAAAGDTCSRLADGFHADFSTRGCRGYVLCAAGRTLLWGACSEDAAWDRASARCLPTADADADADGFLCAGPHPWSGCAGRQPGFYADPASCTRYYYCSADGNRTLLSCRRGQVFDGRDCVPAERGCRRPPAVPAGFAAASSPAPGSCQGAADGYYRDPDLGCRSYYYCSNGHKITYVCSGSYVFDGKECVDPDTYKCPYKSDDCVGLSDGYHFDTDSGCHKYFFCLGGYKITALTCDADRVFDGRRCVEPSAFRCPDGGSPLADSATGPSCAARSDGTYPDEGAGCRRYFTCRARQLTSTSVCPGDKLFNGRDCVSADSYTCGSVEVPSSSPECDGNLNGFFQNVTSGCRTYYFCIDGTKTVLTCPGNEVFNGQLCVDAKSYTCPSPGEVEVRTTCVK
ncbi:uncharacterized protein LOC126336810 [Schistocerca gregaria]|uniref:uncharacterized protein LOC126336810 n=1 Tax=Schistocerca gregaria TaxID=7010 RepID=UPI00211E4603|nr:uncharacterized protein LOC126336810 [Schistocerca gregaria]